MKIHTILFFIFISVTIPVLCAVDMITIAILAKDKAHTLPLFLACIEEQTWPKEKTNLYIRTNNNKDNTVAILKDWINRVGHLYNEIFFDDSDTKERVEKYGQHEWNYERFKVLGRIRQQSIAWAYQHNSHYFVVDCDNFIIPKTLESIASTNLPIVAPLLYSNCRYSNYHSSVDENGYNNDYCPLYDYFLNGHIKGLIELPVVHCTYFIRYEYLPYMCYDDLSCRYEYVIFSDVARKNGIPQYLDNRQIYGRLTLKDTKEELYAEPWFNSFVQEYDFLKAVAY